MIKFLSVVWGYGTFCVCALLLDWTMYSNQLPEFMITPVCGVIMFLTLLLASLPWIILHKKGMI
jgi:hypothetical protein